MIKYISKYRSLFTVVLILGPLLIWFSYSELGQFTGTNENTTSPDYCEIVKAPQTKPVKESVNDLSKLKVDKSVCMYCDDDISIGSIVLNKSVTERFFFPQNISKIYLFNSTFLI